MLSSDRLPKIIFIVGVDGAGKTLYANSLLEELRHREIKAGYVWSRYNNFLSKPLLAMTRLTGHNYKEYHQGVEFGYHNFWRSWVLSYLFVLLQIIDLNLATYFKIRTLTRNKRVVVCDRGPYDTLVDVVLDTRMISLIDRHDRLFFLSLPRDHEVIYIRRALEDIYRKRPEMKYDRNLGLKSRLYNECYRRFGWKKVENTGSPDCVFKKIVRLLA